MDNQPPQSNLSFQFSFTGMLLVSLAVANLFGGAVWLLKARSGDTDDIAIFFCFTLLSPFVMCLFAAGLLKVTRFLSK